MRTVQGLKVVIIGNLGVGKTSLQASWPVACNQLAVHPSLILRICIRTVCLWSLLDGIPFDHWNRFYYQDTPPLQARRVVNSPNPGPVSRSPPSLLSPLPAIAHATIGYRQRRALLVPFVRVFPRRGRRHPHLRRQPVRDACPLVVGVLCVCASRRG